MDEQAQPGVRVQVGFAGRLIGGIIVARSTRSSFDGALKPLSRVLGSEQVLTPETAKLMRAVADRWAGTLSDVLRLAIPPRLVEGRARAGRAAARRLPRLPSPASWTRYTGGPAFLEHLAAGSAPRATWAALPGPRLAGRDRRGGAGDAFRRPRRGDRRPGRPRRRPGIGRAARRDRRRELRRTDGRSRPDRALPAVPAARARPGQGRRRHPRRGLRTRSRISVWSPSGTTVPICTTSRTRRTPTCATCSSCAPTWPTPVR